MRPQGPRSARPRGTSYRRSCHPRRRRTSPPIGRRPRMAQGIRPRRPGGEPAARSPAAGPRPGSIGDLLARLDRLPDGHPSSPYEDGGLAKPLPHRLRQLELGLPAPEREPVESGLLAGFGSPAIERTSPVVPSVASATDDASQTAEPPDGTYGALGPETGVRPEPRPDPRSAGDQGWHIVRARCHRMIGCAVTRAGRIHPPRLARPTAIAAPTTGRPPMRCRSVPGQGPDPRPAPR